MEKFLTRGRSIFLNYEHGFLHGPHHYKKHVMQPDFAITLADQTEIDAVFFNIGIAEHYTPNSPIIKLTSGSDGLEFSHPIAKICSVERALRANAQAVSITLQDQSNDISSLEITSELIDEAKSYGIPVILHATPKKHSSDEGMMHSARLALELGADAVVLKYNFNPQTFKDVVSVAGKCKVIIDMDHVVETESDEIVIMRCKELIEQGVFGFSFGTSLLNHPNPVRLARRLRMNI